MVCQCNFNFHFSHYERAAFPRAATTNYHKADGFKQQKCIVSQFWRPKSRCRQGCSPFKGSTEESFLATSSFWMMLAILAVPWLVDASLQSLPLSSHGHLRCVSVPLCPNFSLLINTPVISYLGPILIQYDLLLT